MIVLSYHAGTLEIHGVAQHSSVLPNSCLWDERTFCFRAPALSYAEIVLALLEKKLPYEDKARAYEKLDLQFNQRREARDYQKEAIVAWQAQQGRGVVVLPTGAGKTHVAVLAMLQKQRNTLVVVPTLDLVRQWYDLLKDAFATEVGIVGGGMYDVKPITVITYDSAYLHMEHIGNRFGLVVFDECHHLPSESYGLAARFCLAPYRLGLTATPERADGQDEQLFDLIGPIVYRRDINEFSGSYLAEYETIQLIVPLSHEERKQYEEARGIYRNFLFAHGIRMADPKGWSQFIMQSTRSKEGRRAMDAYRKQREIAFAAPGKLDRLEQLLHRHRYDRMLIFTQDNATVYQVSRRFLVPVITHQTRVKERSEILNNFKQGIYQTIVTSKVLNEGVDVPEANVAVVLSGSGSVREHVQRLGRILRQKDGKRALLYELVSENTSETHTSQRRREHIAYQM